MGLVGESLRTKNHSPKNHIRVGKSESQGRKITRNATTQNCPKRRFWVKFSYFSRIRVQKRLFGPFCVVAFLIIFRPWDPDFPTRI